MSLCVGTVLQRRVSTSCGCVDGMDVRLRRHVEVVLEKMFGSSIFARPLACALTPLTQAPTLTAWWVHLPVREPSYYNTAMNL